MRLLGTPHGPGNHDREARIRALARAGAGETQSRGGSLDSITCASAVSNRKTARVKISTEAPPPKSLEVEPGNEASQDDIIIVSMIFWMM